MMLQDLTVHRMYGYVIFFVIDTYELGKRMGFYYTKDSSTRKKELMCHVIATLFENGLLVSSPNLMDCLRNDGFISQDVDFDPHKLEAEENDNFIYSWKGTSPVNPITITCSNEIVRYVEKCIVLYLINSSIYIERYEDRDIVSIKSRLINGEMFDVATVHVKYRNIFGRITSQHLVEYFFKNTLVSCRFM